MVQTEGGHPESLVPPFSQCFGYARVVHKMYCEGRLAMQALQKLLILVTNSPLLNIAHQDLPAFS